MQNHASAGYVVVVFVVLNIEHEAEVFRLLPRFVNGAVNERRHIFHCVLAGRECTAEHDKRADQHNQYRRDRKANLERAVRFLLHRRFPVGCRFRRGNKARKVTCWFLQRAAQVRAHFVCALIAAVEVLIQRAHHNVVERGRNLRVEVGGGLRYVADVLERYGNGVVTLKRNVPGQHFVEHDARGIQVAPLGNGLTFRLLGGKVMYGTQHRRTRKGNCVCVHFARNAKVHELDFAALHNDDVLGLDVPVDNARVVGGVQRVEHLHHERYRDARRHGAVFIQYFLERTPVNILQNDIRQAFGFANVERADDVFVRKVQNRARFPLEPAQKLRVVAEFVLKHFYGDNLAAGKVHGAVNLRHSAGADQVDNSITMSYNRTRSNHTASSSSF
ncbi:hypothetical protein SDC9_70562 [bioreactor metagenome]|uniref:Uncharacterized protein n=1 Tax=bioreactor metagenome TaxID=1076179 RepID=A0A644Y822_9ZZZZ